MDDDYGACIWCGADQGCLWDNTGRDDYDAADDSKKSWEDCLAAVRDRMAKGGKGWEPK